MPRLVLKKILKASSDLPPSHQTAIYALILILLGILIIWIWS